MDDWAESFRPLSQAERDLWLLEFHRALVATLECAPKLRAPDAIPMAEKSAAVLVLAVRGEVECQPSHVEAFARQVRGG